MVTFTDSQVGAILARLDRIQENAIAINEERVYWKGVAEKRYAENQELRHQLADNYFQSQQSLKREVERLANRLKSTEEELAMTQKALVNSIEIIDEKNREITRLKEVSRLNANSADEWHRANAHLQNKLDDFRLMADDYRAHRGCFGGTGVASEIDSILNGDGYTQAKV